jgi:hypothetical protein
MQLAQTNPDGNLGAFTAPTQTLNQSTEAGVLNNLETFISQMLGLLTIIASFGFIAYFIYGALKWVMAGGDSGKVQKARDQMTQAAVGLIVVVASYSLIGIVGTVLGLNILHPATVLETLIPR